MLRSNYCQYFSIVLLGISRPLLAAYFVGYDGGPIEESPSVPLDNGSSLYAASWFNSSLPTKFYVHGFQQVITNNSVISMASALYDVYGGQNNIIILNWGEEASDGGLGPVLGYTTHAVPGAKKIGEQLAQVIVNLVARGINKDIHIIGHSLGAQLGGICGAKTLVSGYKVPRITGLDPAGPGYELDVTNEFRLDSSDASLVDSYHTNAGGLGMAAGTGDVDIWLNYQITVPVTPQTQPGCETEPTAIFVCSHQRSVDYFVDSIRNFTAFYGGKATSYSSWVSGSVLSVSVVGAAIDISISGNYYLRTNSASPYGRGVEGATYSSS